MQVDSEGKLNTCCTNPAFNFLKFGRVQSHTILVEPLSAAVTGHPVDGVSSVTCYIASLFWALFHLLLLWWALLSSPWCSLLHLLLLWWALLSLPLPGDHKYIWQDITNELHIKNHKDSRCRTKYNPEVVKTIGQSMNTMSCEQTFAWLSRFKKAMPKTHFHFFCTE